MIDKKLQALSDEEIEKISGGTTKVYNPIGKNDIALVCVNCGKEKLINTKNRWHDGKTIKFWDCSCGTRNKSEVNFSYNLFHNTVSGSTDEAKYEIKNGEKSYLE